MTRNIAASVRQRLLNIAREENRPFETDVVKRFVLERFLYRLSQSEYRERFVLKGAMLLTAWQFSPSRPTRDIDLLGYMDNSVEAVETAIRAICQIPANDGLSFDAASVTGERIALTANYEGVRVKLNASLDVIPVKVQLDVGFGDVVVPGPVLIHLPSTLDFPRSQLRGYTRESVIAEKFETMVARGDINSRIQDFYDIWLLASNHSFDGKVLAQAIYQTFRQRGTSLTTSPTAFSETFALNGDKQQGWAVFIERRKIKQAPKTLQDAIALIEMFLLPVVRALIAGDEFTQHWPAGGSWQMLAG